MSSTWSLQEEALERLSAMIQQEERHYLFRNYTTTGSDNHHRENMADESPAVLCQCHNRQDDTTHATSTSTCTSSDPPSQHLIALQLLRECADIVTDHQGQEAFLLSSVLPTSNKAAVVGKSPSAVSVRDFEEIPAMISHNDTVTSSSSSDYCCSVCHKPIQQLPNGPPPQRHSSHATATSTTTTATAADEFEYDSNNDHVHENDTDSFAFWRHQMFDWACVVMDSYGVTGDIRTHVLSLAFSLLDRYVAHEQQETLLQRHATPAAVPIARDDFQLFGMTALYMAVKMVQGCSSDKGHGACLTIAALVTMSRGFYSQHDMLVTEQEILKALEWRLHAPLVLDYCHLLLDVLQLSTTNESDGQQHDDDKAWIVRLQSCCAYLTELAVSDASLVGCKASLVALACVVLVATRSMDERTDNSLRRHEQMEAFLANVQGLLRIQLLELDGDTHHNGQRMQQQQQPSSRVVFQRVYRQLEGLYGD